MRWAAVSALVLAIAAAAGARTSASREAFDRYRFGGKAYGPSCPVGEPGTVQDFRARADAILRVRLGGSVRRDGWMIRSATVLERFKVAGPAATRDHIEIAEWRGGDAPRLFPRARWLAWFDGLFPQTEWILFLKQWSSFVEYTVISHNEGAHQIVDGTIRMNTESQLGDTWDGQPVSALINELHLPPRAHVAPAR